MKYATSYRDNGGVVGSIVEANSEEEALRKVLVSVPVGKHVHVAALGETAPPVGQEDIPSLTKRYVEALNQRAAFRDESKVPQGLKSMVSKRHNKLLRALRGDEKELEKLVKEAQH